VCNGVAKAAETIRRLDWFEITHVPGTIRDRDVGVLEVSMKIGFKVEP
jgi:flavin-binding protein dodecin